MLRLLHRHFCPVCQEATIDRCDDDTEVRACSVCEAEQLEYWRRHGSKHPRVRAVLARLPRPTETDL